MTTIIGDLYSVCLMFKLPLQTEGSRGRERRGGERVGKETRRERGGGRERERKGRREGGGDRERVCKFL